MLNVTAAGLYLIAAAICLGAAYGARRTSPPAAIATDRRHWIVVATFFVLLCSMRLAGTEEFVRATLRSLLHMEGVYAERRSVQGLIVIAVVAAFGIVAAIVSMRGPRSSSAGQARAIRWARLAMWAMFALVLMRLISLHAIDRLLYRGPHLNWVVDLGSTATVILAAISYLRAVSAGSRTGRSRRVSRGR